MSDDDFWGSDGEDGNSKPDLKREWESREVNFWNSGYREGMEEGKKETFQEGFNAGYAQSAAAGLKWGQTRGVMR
jgi:flagellar biosynthesis/type III secretory pathway protein FliH